MDSYEARGGNAALTCRHYGISRQTFYRWKRRYNPRNLTTLESRSHRPKHVRQPTWSPELAQAVLKLREQEPRWGKDKLVVLLREKGWEVSTSMVGRILKHLKRRGVLREAPRNGVATSKHRASRPYAVRKPKGYEVKAPGDLVELDTLDVRPLPGVVLKHFTARDVVSGHPLGGMWWQCTPGPRPPPRPASWRLSWPGCPSRCGPSRWMGAVSSRRVSRRLVR